MSTPLVKLGDVCEVVLGGTPKTAVSEFWGGSIPWVTPKDMRADKHRFITKTERTLTEAGLASGSTLLPAGSLILSTRAPIGYLRINTVPMCTNQGCKSLVPKPGVNVSYLYYNLLLRRDELNELGTGSTFLELGTPALRNLEIPLPPLAEQERIVAHLERTLGAIDAMEAKFREMAETAERHFRATLDETFADFSSAPAAKLGEVCEVFDARRVPIKQADRKPGSVPYYGASGVQDYVADYLFDEPLVLLGEDGAKWGPGERSAYRITGKAWVNNHAHVLRPREGVDSAYLTAYLNMKDLLPWISGVTVPKLTQARMKEIPLPLPPLAEQERVVARLERAEGVSRRVVALAQEGVAQCGVYRRAVLSEAFGGGEGGGDE